MILNNDYKKAMDRIELSEELKEKIINNVSKTQLNQISKFRPLYIRRIAGLAACFVFCFLSYYAVTNYYMKSPVNIVSVDTPESTSNKEVSDEKITISETVQGDTNKSTPSNEDSSEKTAMSKSIQDKQYLKTLPNIKKDNVDSNGEQSLNANLYTYENPKMNDNQIEVVSPNQEITIENNSISYDNGLPPFAKGKRITEDTVDADITNDISVSKQLTMEQVSTELGYEIKSPQNVPIGYEVVNMSVDTNGAKIIYQSENDKITYKTAKVSEDLSKRNDNYEFMEIEDVNNTNIVLKGIGEVYYNAVWSDNTESFSITSNNGVEKSIMVDMVLSVDYAESSDSDNEN